MEFQYILFDVDQGIATITLNRLDQMNTLNFEMISEINQAIDLCAKDDVVRVVVLTGTGEVFSVNDDMSVMKIAQDRTAQEVADVIEKKGLPTFIRKVMALPKPVIACVNGKCFGAGGELALACDYVIASNTATFGQLYVNIGLIGNTYLLPRLVGSKKALELIWTGRIISAEEAYQLGMINSVVVAGSLIESTYKLARKLAHGPALAIGMAKRAVYGGLNMDLVDGLHLQSQLLGELMKTNDHLEGVAAFLDRRKPSFSGR